MNDLDLQSFVCDVMNADAVTGTDPVQSLWSGYGQIVRIRLAGCSQASSVIVKQIRPPGVGVENARGWSGDVSHARKLRSYEVEMDWYRNWSSRCGQHCRVPRTFAVESSGQDRVFILEDLDAVGFALRLGRLSERRLHACLKWLANFHATFLGQVPIGLWEVGTYWHLQTRPDELAAMPDVPLKRAASKIDQRLSNCRFKTLVHGDAKVANFCFGDSEDEVAAVDFQYVGGGCGMKDVAYLMGSCLGEEECQRREEECLSIYFGELSLRTDASLFGELEREWRSLFPWAWADFDRFLSGWCATHPKLTGYSNEMVRRVLAELKQMPT